MRDTIPRITIVTVTLNRESLHAVYASINEQTWTNWHHFVLGDGIQPIADNHPQRSVLGFSRSLGAEEPGRNMPDGTPNPLLRWAIKHLDLSNYLCFLDDDNVFLPNFLEAMAGALESTPTVGIVLCPAIDKRYDLHRMDGYPEYGRCDNSALMVRTPIAKQVGYPRADMNHEVNQDYKFVKICAELAGWTRIEEPLVIFGEFPNTPPLRGNVKVVYSWAMPIKAQQLLAAGQFTESIELFERAVKLDPFDAWSIWHLAEAYYYAESTDLALNTWRRWLSLVDSQNDIQTDWMLYSRGLVYWMLNKPDEAKLCFQKAIDQVNVSQEDVGQDLERAFNRAIYLLALGETDAAKIAYTLIPSPTDTNLVHAIQKDLAFLKRLIPVLADDIADIIKNF